MIIYFSVLTICSKKTDHERIDSRSTAVQVQIAAGAPWTLFLQSSKYNINKQQSTERRERLKKENALELVFHLWKKFFQDSILSTIKALDYFFFDLTTSLICQ